MHRNRRPIVSNEEIALFLSVLDAIIIIDLTSRGWHFSIRVSCSSV